MALPPSLDADAAAREAFDHARALIRIDTSNPPGNERPAVGYLAHQLRREGIEPLLFEPAPRRANLVARLPGDGSLPPLLLTSHLDAVPPGPGRWTHPPFSGEIADGFLWGRGSLDMKGMTAFQLAAFLALKRAGVPLRRDLILLALADEEDGMTWGSRWMVEHQPELIRAEFALNEVGGFSAYVGRRRVYVLGTAEKGVCWLRLAVHGEGGHGAVPSPAQAIPLLAAAVDRLARSGLASRLTPVTEAFFTQLAAAAGLPRSFLLRAILHGATRRMALQALSRVDTEQATVFRAMLHDTASVTVLRAGERPNVVPPEAEAIVDGRVLPGASHEQFVANVQRVLGPRFSIEVLAWGPPTAAPLESPVIDAVRAATRRLDPAATVVPWLNVGHTDAAQLARLGVQTYGYYPLRLPRGVRFSTLFHAVDERVPVDGYQFGFRLFLDTVLGLCQAPQRES